MNSHRKGASLAVWLSIKCSIRSHNLCSLATPLCPLAAPVCLASKSVSSCSRLRGSQFRLPLCCALPPLCSLRCSLGAPLLRPLAPLLLPLKRPCSLFRPGMAIANPKFGVYIIHIYIESTDHDKDWRKGAYSLVCSLSRTRRAQRSIHSGTALAFRIWLCSRWRLTHTWRGGNHNACICTAIKIKDGVNQHIYSCKPTGPNKYPALATMNSPFAQRRNISVVAFSVTLHFLSLFILCRIRSL